MRKVDMLTDADIEAMTALPALPALRADATKRYEAAGEPRVQRCRQVARLFDLAHADIQRAVGALREANAVKASKYARQAGRLLDVGEKALGGDPDPEPQAQAQAAMTKDGVASEEARTSALVVGICLGAGSLIVLAAIIFGIVRVFAS